MLDTDVIIDILRKYEPAVSWIKKNKNEEIALSGFVKVELLQGCKNKAEQNKVNKTLDQFIIIWPSEQICINAFSFFSKFFLSHNLGIIDALIGATAISYELPIFTFNDKHYKALPGLKVKRPYNKKK